MENQERCFYKIAHITDLKIGMQRRGLKFYKDGINDDLWFDLDLFYGMVKIGHL